MADLSLRITGIDTVDVRFPTSLEKHGSDAMHVDPDYSGAYITISTDRPNTKSFGIVFTLGRGTEIIIKAIDSIKHMVIGKVLKEIVENFGDFCHSVTSETQFRWLGPDKGVTHMAAGGIFNAIWDLWARVEGKPVWQLLADLKSEEIVKVIDFSYITDFLTKEDAMDILRWGQIDKQKRVEEMRKDGYPAYTTSAGWLGYSDEQIESLCRESMDKGFKFFKMKVGQNREDDCRRLKLMREIVGDDVPLMIDANQRWSVAEAIEWMQHLARYRPYWIEEPTHPDDVLGHIVISQAMAEHKILVATGEHCANRVLFKQLISGGGAQVVQIDACRLGSINECLAVILMAAKEGVPVCPHAGGLGLCEYVQHLAFFDFICVSKSLENRMCEYSAHLHEHFVSPLVIKNGRYSLPETPGYSVELVEESVKNHTFPHGAIWQKLISEGKTC